MNEMEDTQSVLQEYGLTAQFIEPVSPLVWKVYTDYGIFALKKLKEGRGKHFTDHMVAIEEKAFVHSFPFTEQIAVSFSQQAYNTEISTI